MIYETVSIGTVTCVPFRPVEVSRTAVIINAPAVVLVHNRQSAIDSCLDSRQLATSKFDKRNFELNNR